MKKKQKKVTKKRSNFQGRDFPKNPLAQCGYWSSRIQDVVKKWTDKDKNQDIGEHWIQYYTPLCFYAVFFGDSIEIKFATPEHKGCVIDLLNEFYKLDDIDALILKFCNQGDAPYDGETTYPKPWNTKRLCDEIKGQAGITLKEGTISTRIKRLRINDEKAPKAAPIYCEQFIQEGHSMRPEG